MYRDWRQEVGLSLSGFICQFSLSKVGIPEQRRRTSDVFKRFVQMSNTWPTCEPVRNSSAMDKWRLGVPKPSHSSPMTQVARHAASTKVLSLIVNTFDISMPRWSETPGITCWTPGLPFKWDYNSSQKAAKQIKRGKVKNQMNEWMRWRRPCRIVTLSPGKGWRMWKQHWNFSLHR